MRSSVLKGSKSPAKRLEKLKADFEVEMYQMHEELDAWCVLVAELEARAKK